MKTEGFDLQPVVSLLNDAIGKLNALVSSDAPMQKFSVDLYLDPSMWDQKVTRAIVMAKSLSEVSFGYVADYVSKVNSQPFGLEENDVIKMVVKRA